jgi:23S rRNA (guanosine2251-2'-O)-methyltransferase
VAESLWIWGRHSVLEALRSGAAETILISDTARDAPILSEIEKEAGSSGVVVRRTAPGEIDRRADGQVAQGVVAQVRLPRSHQVDGLLQVAEQNRAVPLLLILDQIQDPRNLGSLLRSAEAAGAHGAIMTGHNSAPVSGVVAKASAGALYHLPLCVVSNLAQVLAVLRKRNIWTAALGQNSRNSLFATDLTVPLGIVVGNEGSGVRRLTAEKVDMTMSIPMFGKVESLNASVAGAIALFEAARQRQAA